LKLGWKDPEKGRSFLIKYANDNGFDPLNLDSWYLQTGKQIKSAKVSISIHKK
jgi:hypothetical protein